MGKGKNAARKTERSSCWGDRGAVRAMVGGRNYAASQFNRVTQAKRQPGSVFKPIVYLAGLNAGLTPSTVMIDAPINIDGWQPGNFNGKYAGEMTLSQALAQSVNTVAVRVAEKAGTKRIIQTARRLGISEEFPSDLSLALGTADMTMLELTAAYGSFANGGYGVWPFGIEEIRDGDGEMMYRRQGAGAGRVISPRNVNNMNQMLSEVIQSGTGKSARIGRPAAGKTGTSQNYRDAWFVGYTADFVAAVWIGNDNGAPMKRLTGGGLPTRIWRDIMTAAHGGLAKREIQRVEPSERDEPAQNTGHEKSDGFWKQILDALQ